MSKQITITVPDGYEDTDHVILVATGDTAAQAYATVFQVTAEGTAEVEEIGGDTLIRLLGSTIGNVVKASRLRRAGL